MNFITVAYQGSTTYEKNTVLCEMNTRKMYL